MLPLISPLVHALLLTYHGGIREAETVFYRMFLYVALMGFRTGVLWLAFSKLEVG
jgi:hypothetical protein